VGADVRVLINASYLVSEGLGGSWTLTAQLIRHLTSRADGHEFFVLVNDRVASTIPVSPVSGTRIIVPVADSRVRRVAWDQTVLRRYVRSLRPDVYHSPGNTLPVGLACKSVVTVHDLQVYHFPENFQRWRRWYLKTALPLTVRAADRVIAISEFTRRDILSTFRVPPEKVVTVMNGGLADDELRTAARPADVAARYRLPERFLLSVGSSFPHKNLLRMLEAYSGIASEIPESLVILGEALVSRGPLLDFLESSGLRSSGRVLLLPFVPRADLLGVYGAATALVFPSLFEGFGIPAIEAMGCGCPVVASNATSLPEVIGNAGLLFDPLKIEEMGMAMRTVCLDGNLRRQLVERGTERARDFSWQRNAEQTLRVYEDVAAR
jgi:glycosyltransferase involved in cell wall biosynthesis